MTLPLLHPPWTHLTALREDLARHTVPQAHTPMPTVSYTGQIILPMQLHPPSFSIHKGVILDPSVAQIYFPLGPMSMQVLLQFLLFSCCWSRPGT